MNRDWTLLVGDFSGAEFAPVADIIAKHGQVVRASTPSEAATKLAAAAQPPVVMVLAWPRPGAISQAEVASLRKAAPLSRLLAVLGSWCEGEGRSGHVIPGVIRTVWHQWIPRWTDEFQPRRAKLPAWGLPETSGDDERLLSLAAQRHSRGTGMIAVVSRDLDAAELFGAACRQRGFYTAWLLTIEHLLRVSPPAAILWDGATSRIDELATIRRKTTAPIVALIDFPRADDVRRATESGAAAVLGRPLILDNLFWHLDRLAMPPPAIERVA